MQSPGSERRLAAIMFTDIVGYSALAQSNETLAMELLEGNRKLIRPILSKYGGNEIKTMGDGSLVEFQSALEALNCAIEMQRHVHEDNMAAPPEKRTRLRIGIHVGDVIHRGGDIFGDAVNIASRIQPLATGGGICISGQVFDQVRNKTESSLSRLEPMSLKNISLPIEVYKVVMPWEMTHSEPRTKLDPRRLAVLPLRNMSPDPNDEYFADGMTEELITSLAGISELTVIARTSVMQYKAITKKVTEIGRELNVGSLIEGSVRKSGNKLRITVQLVNAQDDGHVWAQNYDRELDDIFAIQSEIAEKVAEALRVKLVQSDRSRLGRSPTEDAEAYALYMKGRYYWNERTDKGIKKAMEYFTEATRRDPHFALGYSGLADCYTVMARNEQADPEIGMRMAEEFSRKALAIDDRLAEAHANLAGIVWNRERDVGKAEAEFKRAIELKPNYSTAHQWYSHLLAAEKRLPEAMTEIMKALELDPLSLVINVNVGDGLYYLKEYDRAIEQFSKVIEMDPSFEVVYPSLIQVYVRTSMFDEALHQVEKYGKLANKPAKERLLRASVYAAMGKAEETRKLLAEVEAVYKQEHISPYNIALVYFLLADNTTAFEWLEIADRSYDSNLFSMGIDFELDNVRTDPRYLSLIDRIGLERRQANK